MKVFSLIKKSTCISKFFIQSYILNARRISKLKTKNAQKEFPLKDYSTGEQIIARAKFILHCKNSRQFAIVIEKAEVSNTEETRIREIGYNLWVLLCRLSTISGFAADLIGHEYRGGRAGTAQDN